MGGRPPLSPVGLIVLYNDDAPAPKLNVGYDSQPKMRASGQAGRRPAGVLGAWVRAARVVGHTKTSPPFLRRKDRELLHIIYKVGKRPPPAKARSGHLVSW